MTAWHNHQPSQGRHSPLSLPFPLGSGGFSIRGQSHELGTRGLWDLPAALGHATSCSMHPERAWLVLLWVRALRAGHVALAEVSKKQTNAIYHSLMWPRPTSLLSRVMKPSGGRAHE